MSRDTDIGTDIAKLSADLERLEDENRKLGRINAHMLEALNFALPVLQGGLTPQAVDFDAVNIAITKLQNARAEVEDDYWPGKFS